MLVDSHCHASDVWFEPVEVLLAQMDRIGIDRAVVTQILGQFDNGYLADCLARHGDRLAGVGAVDVSHLDALRHLEELAAAGFVGVRFRPDARRPTGDSMAIWTQAARLGLIVSCVGPAAAFAAPAMTEVLNAAPELILVLEHLGGLARPDFDGSEQTREAVLALAGFPNVYLKVPGLGQLGAKRPDPGDIDFGKQAIQPVLAAIEAFGPNRLMWGSDFPPVASREGYANALTWTRAAILRHRPDAVSDIFGDVAARVFRLS